MTVITSRTIVQRKRGRRGNRVLAWVAQHVVLVSLAILFVAPVVFVLLTSFMSDRQALTAS